jgi:hypothetical protein
MLSSLGFSDASFSSAFMEIKIFFHIVGVHLDLVDLVDVGHDVLVERYKEIGL